MTRPLLSRAFVLALLLNTLPATPVFAADMAAGVAAYSAQDYAGALPIFQEHAAAGDDDAMWYLGKMYQNGWAVAASPQESHSWYLKSAEAGDLDAQWDVGVDYELGRGVEADEEVAVDWYTKAAEQGQPSAMNEMGLRYENGNGVRKSVRKAAEWYEKAAAAGNLTGTVNLGVLYENGDGVDQSFTEAARLYAVAADKEYPDGMAFLGEMYQNGKGVEQDINRARQLYEAAAAAGNEYAQKKLADMGIEAPAATAAAQPQQGDELFAMAAELLKVENYTMAQPILQKLAYEVGHARSQTVLGAMYENGLGVEQSFTEAAALYRLAADNGSADAMYNLAAMLYDGRDGVPAATDEAVELFKQSAALGQAQAQAALNSLGL